MSILVYMKIGIFGGAFDPFHQEHKNLIIAAHNELRLDRVIVLPSYLPPHKTGQIAPYEDRRAMVEAGCADLPYVTIDDLEQERGVLNPTSVTLPILREKYPCDEFFFIMGGDSARNFHRWIDPWKIVKCATLVVASREGAGESGVAVDKIRRVFRADVRRLCYCGSRVSSSAIKASIMVGLSPEGLDKKVLAIIRERGLYTTFSDLVERLRSDIPEQTFLHAARTAIYAESFSGLLGLKFEDVFLSGLFHDCAKHLPIHMDGVPDPVVHQFTGADRARDYYGIDNEIVLDAIRYHTTGKPNMTSLGKLIFCADILEPNRVYDGVDELRRIISMDFEKGFVACANRCYDYLLEKGGDVYYLTKECVDYYNGTV